MNSRNIKMIFMDVSNSKNKSRSFNTNFVSCFLAHFCILVYKRELNNALCSFVHSVGRVPLLSSQLDIVESSGLFYLIRAIFQLGPSTLENHKSMYLC